VLPLRALFFTILLPGTTLVLVPSMLLRRESPLHLNVLEPPRLLGLVFMGLGGAVLLRCILDFLLVGKGTLAPVDPPRKLVRVGLYRRVRNPMYVGVVTTLFGETLFFQSRAIAIYAVVVWTIFHLFVVFYEEPRLQDSFGAEYEEYRAAVPRWIPRLRAESRP
jgi:protein-S-isoprenylcysteine O-methyltransferase Ste14